MARGSLFAAVLALGLLLPGLPGAETVPEVREDDSPPPISAKDAERLFLVAAGFGRAQDTLPSRVTREPMPSGPAKGMVCHLEEMLGPYYRLRGWDAAGGPTPETLARLRLTAFAPPILSTE